MAIPNPWLSQADFRAWLIAHASEYVSASSDFRGCTHGDLAVPFSDLPASVTAIVPPEPSLEFILSKRRATEKAIEIGLSCPVDGILSWGGSGPKAAVHRADRQSPDGRRLLPKRQKVVR